MTYNNNAIFTRIATSVHAVLASAYCTMTYSPTPSHWPTVFGREIGHFTPNGTVTMSNAQDISESTWEVQIFSNLQLGAKEQAYKLLDAVKDAFRGMYFVETFESPVDQNENKYYTLVARFRRIIGSGEQMT